MKVKLLHPNAKVPTRAHADDLGFDLYATEASWITPGETKKIPIGVAVELPPGWGALILVRSGHGARGLVTTSSVVDPGYRGELHVVLQNNGRESFVYVPGDRIGQLVPVPRMAGSALLVEGFEAQTSRDAAGFGSTGK